MRLGYWIEKILYITVAFAAIVFFLWIFKVWGNEQINYFLLAGDLQSLLIVLAVSTCIGMVFEKLWKWEVRAVFRKRR